MLTTGFTLHPSGRALRSGHAVVHIAIRAAGALPAVLRCREATARPVSYGVAAKPVPMSVGVENRLRTPTTHELRSHVVEGAPRILRARLETSRLMRQSGLRARQLGWWDRQCEGRHKEPPRPAPLCQPFLPQPSGATSLIKCSSTAPYFYWPLTATRRDRSRKESLGSRSGSAEPRLRLRPGPVAAAGDACRERFKPDRRCWQGECSCPPPARWWAGSGRRRGRRHPLSFCGESSGTFGSSCCGSWAPMVGWR